MRSLNLEIKGGYAFAASAYRGDAHARTRKAATLMRAKVRVVAGF